MIPGTEKKCGCLSGISDRQALLLVLDGVCELLAWKVATAKAAFATQEPADKAEAEYLGKVEKGLANLRKWATENAYARPITQRQPGEEG